MRRSVRIASQTSSSTPLRGDAHGALLSRAESREAKPNHQTGKTRSKGTRRPPENVAPPLKSSDIEGGDLRLADKKWRAWSSSTTSSPFPAFARPYQREIEVAHRVLKGMHQDALDEVAQDPETPNAIPHVLDAIVISILCQATSWDNAKRAIRSMTQVYGSVSAYEGIFAKGVDKLQETIRCGGLHVRKSRLIMATLEQVWQKHAKWDLDHMFELSNEEAMKELMSYKGMGPKSAFVVLGWCLNRQIFTVDTHVYRICGLWGWRPTEATREKTQAHLDAKVPSNLKVELHFLLIAHGRLCSVCRGGSKKGLEDCEAFSQLQKALKDY